MKAWLSQSGVDLQARDFFSDRFTKDELRRLIGDRPVSDFFSWASPSFRKLGLDRNDLDDDRLIAMMLDEPRLIRRPLIAVDGEVIEPTSGSERIISMLSDRLGV